MECNGKYNNIPKQELHNGVLVLHYYKVIQQ